MLLEAPPELVVTVLAAQDVIEELRSSGASAAASDARPGLAIGVGGNPTRILVLYGVSISRSENESCPSGVGSAYSNVASIPRACRA